MAEHLSKLVLDEIAAGLSSDAAALAHSADCAECRERLKQHLDARTQVEGAAQFERVFAKLKVHLNTPSTIEISVPAQPVLTKPKRRRWGFVVAPAFAVAAALLVFLVSRPKDDANATRLKGGVSVRVLHAPDGAAMTSARPGEHVVLAVSKANQPFGLVMAVDASGDITQVWPSRAPVSAQLPAGPEARLTPGFEVTPGTVVLHAFLSQEPLKVETARALLEREVANARTSGKMPLDAEPLPFPGVVRAAATLNVKSGE